MPPLSYPTQTEIDSWELQTRGVRDGSHPTESFEFDASTAARRWFCKWGKRYDVVSWLLGKQATYVESGVTKLSRLLPQQHPTKPALVATKVTRITGHVFVEDDDDGMPSYEQAEVEVLYEHAPFALKEDDEIDGTTVTEKDRFTSLEEVEPSAEYLQLPGGVMKYIREAGNAAPHGTAVPFNVGKIVPQEVFTVKWHSLPDSAWGPDSPLWQRIYGTAEDDVPFLGCINRQDFFGRPSGTVLFSRVKPQRRRAPDGESFLWDLTYEFTYKPSGWNWLYYFGTGPSPPNGWYFVGTGFAHHFAATVPDNYSIYNADNLDLLFSLSA